MLGDLFEHPWWLLTLAAVGLVAIVGGFLSLFTSIGSRPKRLVATTALPVDSERFLEAVSVLVGAPLGRGGRAELLNNGDAFFPEIVKAIRQATRTINFSVYIWASGKVSSMILEALIERARAGVQVRVLLDGFGALRAPEPDLERLMEAGGRVERFRQARLSNLLRFHKRNHRRAIVIDGEIGFTGGAAVADHWLGDARNPDEWRDSMVRVTGELAASLQSAFVELWAHTCGEMLVGPDFYGSGGLPGRTPVRIDREVARAAQTAQRAARAGHTGRDAGRTAQTERGATHAAQSEGEAVHAAHDEDGECRHVHVVSSPSSQEHPLSLFFVLTFLAARRTLHITASYFVPAAQIRQVAAERARAGVDVRILVPGEHTRGAPIRQAGRSYYEELLRSGVRIYEYEPTRMHCKLMVVDGLWSVVGSANMDVRSKELNHENVIGILDADFAGQLERTFHEDLAHAKEIRLEEWRRRGIGTRVLERFWALFAEQY